jgi:prevent-host-death family protein
MIKISLKEAEGHLGELIEEAAAGQEVVITSDGGPAVRLMLVAPREHVDQGSYEPPKTVGQALDRFIGTWSAEQEAEVLKAVEIFEQVDESFWQ